MRDPSSLSSVWEHVRDIRRVLRGVSDQVSLVSSRVDGLDVPVLSNRIAFHAYSTAGVNVSSTPVKVQLAGERFNFGGGFDFANSRFVVPVDGVYQLNVDGSIGSPGAGTFVSTQLWLNGGSFAGRTLVAQGNSGANTPRLTLSHAVQLAVGDVLEVYSTSSTGPDSATAGFSGFLVFPTE